MIYDGLNKIIHFCAGRWRGLFRTGSNHIENGMCVKRSSLLLLAFTSFVSGKRFLLNDTDIQVIKTSLQTQVLESLALSKKYLLVMIIIDA